MEKQCEVESCLRPKISRRFCEAHHYRFQKNGDPQADIPIRSKRPGAKCAVVGCQNLQSCQDFCQKHYHRWHLYGDPLGGRAFDGEPLVCTIEGCETITKGHGFCTGHLARWRKHGDAMDRSPLRFTHPYKTQCSVDDCGRQARNNWMCGLHWARYKAHGDVHKVAKVNSYPEGSRRILEDGYVEVKVSGHPNARKNAGNLGWVREHLLVMSEILGRPIATEDGETVHHRNGIRSDNDPSNLELMVSIHPPGQRVIDLVVFARSILKRYGREAAILASPAGSLPV
jgi:hypothetical protein